MLRISRSLASLVVLPGVLLLGCQDAPPAPVAEMHEHGEGHHHPETLAEALTELTELRDTIRDAFAADDTDKAHDPLHEVGHIIEVVQELAEKEKLPEERLAAVKTSTEELFTAFGEVDKTMHGGEGSSYKDVSAKIDAAMAALKSAITGEAPAAPAGDAAGEVPAADAPAAEAPKADAPAAEAPAGDAPAADAPAGDAPKAE
ncbi:MAG: hypothetical protein ACKPJJ_08420 [Planctomycetaceae bacterium]